MFFKPRKKSLQTDAELLQQYKNSGNALLAGELFSRYAHLVFGVCMKYLKEEEESQDAVMNIFEKLLEDLKKHEISNFRSWLHSVSRNHCLMELRKRVAAGAKEEFSESFMESGYVLHLHNENETELNLKKMEECIQRLTEEQKQCVQLFYLDEKCYKEIVELTSFSMNEVKSYIQNGKRNLKNCMERRNNG